MACQVCGRDVPVKYVEYYQNIGMLVLRQMRSAKGNMCKRCSNHYFFRMTGLTLVTGWWGLISAILNPFLIVNNMVRVVSTMSLADAPMGGFPVAGGAPVARKEEEKRNPYRQV